MFEIDAEDDAPRASFKANVWAHALIREWFRAKNVKFDVGSNSFFIGQKNVTIGNLARDARVEIAYGKRKISKDASVSVIESIATSSREEALADVTDSIVMPRRTDDTILRSWLKELLVEDMDSEEFENCVAVMKQWLWLVQRALLGKPQQWHIMPIFWGGQGGGKSTQIAKLLAPLGSFTAKNTFQVFMGQFDALPMHWNYALFLDEMGSASRAEAARVKMCIDSPIIPGRGMYTDEGRRLVRNASFIAATNEPPPHGLMDTTGGRRFYSLECRSTAVVGERARFFNELDCTAIWHCVDPEGPAPVLERREQVALKQHEVNRALSPLERFVTEGCIMADGVTLPLPEFRDAFREYCLRCGIHFSFPTFRQAASQLEALGMRVSTHAGSFTIRDLAVR